jgi:hypothetical protein
VPNGLFPGRAPAAGGRLGFGTFVGIGAGVIGAFCDGAVGVSGVGVTGASTTSAVAFLAAAFFAGAFFAGFASAAGFATGGNFSRNFRTTGGSTVDDAERTNSPISWSFARTSLLSMPKSFANS